MSTDKGFEINEATYQWSVRLFTLLRRIARVNLKLHQKGAEIREGDIFLFNHFARFETFIPQYFIYQETGAYCRSIASAEFFDEDDAFSSYLRRVGAVPTNHPQLLSFLAAEILRGRKVIVFPEGGMVKDRRVVDGRGGYSVYSRSAQERRKHHTGAAYLALTLDAFKWAVHRAKAAGDDARLERWAESLGLAAVGDLLAAASRPTLIVPSNITFYPIRVSDNLLRKGAELLNRGLSRRLSEELLIEGNILLRDTDMDILLGTPVRAGKRWRWWERKLLAKLLDRVTSLPELFSLRSDRGRWDARLMTRIIRAHAEQIRDEYMHGMYKGVTVNLSHLASSLILRLVESDEMQIAEREFTGLLYRCVKRVQIDDSIHLHRSLQDPECYVSLLDGESAGLEQFLATTIESQLVQRESGRLRFLPKLLHDHAFDEVRLENLVEVYANEVAPLDGVQDAVTQAIARRAEEDPLELPSLRFDDLRRAHEWDRRAYSKPRHREINDQQTATESGEPFLRIPHRARDVGVLAVHGFLSSPFEMRGVAERCYELGFPVLGVRLRGHATSPWDLRDRSWEDWLASVGEGYRVLGGYVSRVVLVGFSTGGALCLRLAAERPVGLAGVVAVAVPMRFRNRNMRFVPLVHGANRLVRWVSASEGVMPFRPNASEHPHINYYHMPVRGLYELTRLVDELDARLPDVSCPVALVQATEDPIVEPESVDLIRERLVAAEVTVTRIDSDCHGILHQDIGGTQARIVEFVEARAASTTPQRPPPMDLPDELMTGA